jgi:hypothetical protein
MGLVLLRLDNDMDTSWEEVSGATFEAGAAIFETSSFSMYGVALHDLSHGLMAYYPFNGNADDEVAAAITALLLARLWYRTETVSPTRLIPSLLALS